MPVEKQRALFKSPKSFDPSSSIISRGHVEVIPDSEDERELERGKEAKLSEKGFKKFIEVIEISSDDSEDDVLVTQSPTKQSAHLPKTPNRTGSQRPHYSRMRIIESSDEDSDPDIIEISDDSFEVTEVKSVTKKPPVASRVQPPGVMVVDEAIIIFDEPKSASTPIRIGKKKAGPLHPETLPRISDILEDTASFGFPTNSPGPSKQKESTYEARTSKKFQDAPRRNTKKAQLEAEQKRRHAYAQQLFNDLNDHVFEKGLPEATKLNWNKRLLTTAGRAKYHRSREGVQTTEIELAEKILDCDERIRNTLSHEMCHLATWIIDKKIDEHHGRLFKFWANRVMKKRPEILVSIKHDYEIAYPYNWECEKCAKTYGRFSKSIRPDECRCGACKEGILIPLFQTRRPRNTPKLSRLAAAKPQGKGWVLAFYEYDFADRYSSFLDSPRAKQDIRQPVPGSYEESDSEVDVRAITKILALTTITKH